MFQNTKQCFFYKYLMTYKTIQKFDIIIGVEMALSSAYGHQYVIRQQIVLQKES